MKRLKLVIGIIIAIIVAEVVFCAVLFAISQTPERKAYEQLALAKKYFLEDDYEQAITAYQAAIELDAKCEEAYIGLADVYIELGEYELAAEVLEDTGIDSEDIEKKMEEVELLVQKIEEQQTEVEDMISTVEALSEEPEISETIIVEKIITNDVIMNIQSDQEYTLPGNESGHTLYIKEYESDTYGENKIEIKTDVCTESISQGWIFVEEAYIIYDSLGRCFLLVSADLCSSDFKLYVYRIENGNLKKLQELSDVWINESSSIGEQKMILAKQLQVLGTYNGYKEYCFDESGLLCTEDDIYDISDQYSMSQVLTISKELPVILDGQESTLSVGTKIRIIGTDDNGIAVFQIDGTDTKGEIRYITGDGTNTWGNVINGIQDYEYFEFLPYAG